MIFFGGKEVSVSVSFKGGCCILSKTLQYCITIRFGQKRDSCKWLNVLPIQLYRTIPYIQQNYHGVVHCSIGPGDLAKLDSACLRPFPGILVTPDTLGLNPFDRVSL